MSIALGSAGITVTGKQVIVFAHSGLRFLLIKSVLLLLDFHKQPRQSFTNCRHVHTIILGGLRDNLFIHALLRYFAWQKQPLLASENGVPVARWEFCAGGR